MDEYKVAESLGGLTSAIQGFEKKFSEFVAIHSQEHSAIWRKLDGHSKTIIKITSFFTAVGAIFALVVSWIKLKVGE